MSRSSMMRRCRMRSRRRNHIRKKNYRFDRALMRDQYSCWRRFTRSAVSCRSRSRSINGKCRIENRALMRDSGQKTETQPGNACQMGSGRIGFRWNASATGNGGGDLRRRFLECAPPNSLDALNRFMIEWHRCYHFVTLSHGEPFPKLRTDIL